ncbi:MAG: FMN-binding negative transcriptional regulator [Hyphomicrobiaceae bacterium]
MYVPEHYRLGDVTEQHALMRAYPFAALITTREHGFEVTHLPTALKNEGALGVVECHMARANPHWKAIAENGRGLLIFTGPEAYITPAWYPSKAAHGRVVPTWNYAVVHAHGTADIVDDRAWLVRHVGELTDQQETGTPAPWATSDAPGNFIEMLSRGIVGIRFTIERLEGKAKMSQNRELPDRDGVVAGLRTRGGAADSKVADFVATAAEKDRNG